MPIGNLTSQIFANIYLNEFDQFVLHSLKPLGYVRYGDDFVLWYENELSAQEARVVGTQFLYDNLSLELNSKHDAVQPVSSKLSYLGLNIWPTGSRLQHKIMRRIEQRLTLENSASYSTLIAQNQPKRYKKRFAYNLFDKLTEK